LAQQIGSFDGAYKQLFLTAEWRSFFDSKDAFTLKEATEVEQRISHYLEESHQTHRFNIAEAFISYANPSQETGFPNPMPFLVSLQIGHRDKPDETGAIVVQDDSQGLEVTIDYWAANAAKRVTLKAEFQYVIVTTLAAVATNLRIKNSHHPTTNPPSLSMLSVSKDKKRVLSRDKKMKKVIQTAAISKFICSTSNPDKDQQEDSSFQVFVDGIELTGVKFLQAIPTWANPHLKSFPVSVFTTG